MGKQKTSATTKKRRYNLAQVEEEETNDDVFRHHLKTLQCHICCKPFESQVYSAMQKRTRGGNVRTGRSVSVVRLCPRPAPADEDGGAEVAQQYTVAVKGNQPGSHSLTASGTVPFVRRLEGYKAQEFLFVPDACWGSSQTLIVTVTVTVTVKL